MKKILFIVFAFISYFNDGYSAQEEAGIPRNIYAESLCTKYVRKINKFCVNKAPDRCQDLKGCLERRDTCNPQPNMNESECTTLNNCSRGNNAFFTGLKCKYRWSENKKSPESSRCVLENLFFKNQCPGRASVTNKYGDALGDLSRFLLVTKDSIRNKYPSRTDENWNCQGNKHHIDYTLLACETYLKILQRDCSSHHDQLDDEVKQVPTCSSAESFTPSEVGTFSKEANTIQVDVNDSSILPIGSAGISGDPNPEGGLVSPK
jgi:hypothetical protein